MSTEESNAGLYLVVDKALCRCTLGSSPAELSVTSHTKVYANKKLVATDADTTFVAPMFGSCKAKNGSACAFAAAGKWGAEPGKSLYDAGKFKILTEAAQIMCANGGKITISTHGQTETIQQSEIDALEPAMLSSMGNCLISIESINRIKTDKSKPVKVSHTTANDVKAGKTLVVRPRTKMLMKAFAGGKALELDVNWAYFQKDEKGKIIGLKLYQGLGSPFAFVLKKPGTYYIEGFGSKDKVQQYDTLVEGKGKVKEDPKCFHQIDVLAHNSIVAVVPQDKANAKIGQTKDKKKMIYIRQGATAQLKVETKFPLGEFDLLRVNLKAGKPGEPGEIDVSENEKFCKVENNIISITSENANTIYHLSVQLDSFDPDNILDSSLSSAAFLEIYATQNEVVALHFKLLSTTYMLWTKNYDSEENVAMVRPGSRVKVSTVFDFDQHSQANSLERKKVKWTRNGSILRYPDPPQEPYDGHDFEHQFDKPGTYKFQAALKDAWGPFVFAKTRNTHTLKVCHNSVVGLSVDSGPYYTHREYRCKARLLFTDYTKELDGNLTWEIERLEAYPTGSSRSDTIIAGKYQNYTVGPKLSWTDEMEIGFSLKAGKYAIRGVFKDHLPTAVPFQIEIEVRDGTVEYWEFTDSEKRRIGMIGMRQQFNLQLKVPAWAQQRLQVHLWVHDKKWNMKNLFRRMYIKELEGYFEVDRSGELFVTIGEDSELWTECLRTSSHWSGVYADLFFTVVEQPFPTLDLVPHAHLSGEYFLQEIDRRTKQVNTPSAKWKRTGRYLQVTAKEDYTAFFADADGEKLYDILVYGEGAKIVVYCHNAVHDQQYTLELYENLEGEDKFLAKSELGLSNKPERMLTLELPTDSPDMGIQRKDHDGKPEALPRLFYFMLYKAGEKEPVLYYPCTRFNDDTFTHPDELEPPQPRKMHVDYLRQLKVAAINRLTQSTRNNFPVVIGSGSYDAKKKRGCICQEYNLLWGNKVSCEFRKKLVQICAELWGEARKIEMANGLMAVMGAETARTFKSHIIEGLGLKEKSKITVKDFMKSVPDLKNKGKVKRSSRAVGLIQFTESPLIEFGKFKAGSGWDALDAVKLSFAQMSEEEQLDWVKKYFEKAAKKITIPEDIYSQTFSPVLVGKDLDTIIYSKGSDQYAANASLDTGANGNKDGSIQKRELIKRYYDSCEEGERTKFYYVCEMDTSSKPQWHDPVLNPQLNKYNFYGTEKDISARYGNVRKHSDGDKRFHAGIDLFGIPEVTEVFASLNCRFVHNRGTGLCLEVIDTNELIAQMQLVGYKLTTKNSKAGEYLAGTSRKGHKGDESEFELNSTDKIYFVYHHMFKRYPEYQITNHENIICAGTPIGLVGVEGGADNTQAPHLHFEVVNMTKNPNGTYRLNPALFINLQTFNDKEQDEAKKPWRDRAHKKK